MPTLLELLRGEVQFRLSLKSWLQQRVNKESLSLLIHGDISSMESYQLLLLQTQILSRFLQTYSIEMIIRSGQTCLKVMDMKNLKNPISPVYLALHLLTFTTPFHKLISKEVILDEILSYMKRNDPKN